MTTGIFFESPPAVGAGFVTLYWLEDPLVIRSAATLPRVPGSIALIAICTWLTRKGTSVLRASTLSSVVWKKTLSFVRTTVPSGMRISEVVRFVNRSRPTAHVSSVREPVAVPVTFPVIGAVRVWAGMSPSGPARRSYSSGPSGALVGVRTTVA